MAISSSSLLSGSKCMLPAINECFLAAAGGLEVRVRLTKVLPQHLREEKIWKHSDNAWWQTRRSCTFCTFCTLYGLRTFVHVK